MLQRVHLTRAAVAARNSGVPARVVSQTCRRAPGAYYHTTAARVQRAVLSVAAGGTIIALAVSPASTAERDEAGPVYGVFRSGAAASTRAGGAGGRDAPTGGEPELNLPFDLKLPDIGPEIGLGVVGGFCAGYAVKKVSKVAALCIGLGLIGVQLARHKGLIDEPDWKKMEGAVVKALDADGDGKLSDKDVKIHLQSFIRTISMAGMCATSFGIAFMAGLRWG